VANGISKQLRGAARDCVVSASDNSTVTIGMLPNDRAQGRAASSRVPWSDRLGTRTFFGSATSLASRPHEINGCSLTGDLRELSPIE
jgi:hypothetical protein